MLYSGIAWTSAGFVIETLDEEGRQALPSARFGPGQAAAITTYLKSAGSPLVAVVESTNGVLDGGLVLAGIAVYRADPWSLPERPLLASVPARDLAEVARRDLSSLTRLEITGGTLTGRIDELVAAIDSSAADDERMRKAGRCLSHGSREGREIALTFDDGPKPPYTGQILDILAEYQIPATFFCVGLQSSAFPDEIARIREQKHGLGNHTWSHPYLPDLSRPQLSEQITRTTELLGGGTLFRPPYGSRTPEVMSWLGEEDVTIALWDVEPNDWARPGPEEIARIALEQTRPGSIILLHDGGGDRSQTVAALPALIEGLFERDYRFVLVDELLKGR
ncbi:polysaccharide deacetylase family protein [Nonomuraea longicatena]|uniref:Polysaccharide deacetylase family protein n=1 Tax=Nonomuraea longicatena TaxID=83682 RepID=A0ABN1Q2J7_9ACTN